MGRAPGSGTGQSKGQTPACSHDQCMGSNMRNEESQPGILCSNLKNNIQFNGVNGNGCSRAKRKHGNNIEIYLNVRC